MPNENLVVIAGHLGRDAETKFTSAGKSVTNFSIGITRKWGAEGQEKEVTDWPNVVAWELPDRVRDELVKGAGVRVIGRISTRSYEAKDGRKVYVTEVVAEDVIPKPKRGSPQFMSKPKSAQEQIGDDLEDPVPF